MFRDIDKGIISAVYVMYQDRLEREPRIWELFKFQVNKMNCKYYPNGVETDLTDAQTQFFTGVLSLTNKLYANLTRDKAIKTFDKRAEEGKTHGIIPYGYEKADDGGYKINEFEGKIVKRIYQMSLDGSGAYTIAKKLNEDGIKTKFNNNTSKKTTFKRKDSYTNEITVFKKSDVEWRSSVIQSMLSNTDV